MKRKFDALYSGTGPKSGENDDEVVSIDLGEIMKQALGGGGGPAGKFKQKQKKIDNDHNHIYFYSEVNRDSAYELCSLIREVDDTNTTLKNKLKVDEIPVYIHIMSNGGCIFSAFNVIDYIKSCKNPVYSVIEGCAASAATLISVVCDKRYIMPSAHMLIHQISSGWEGKMAEMEDEMINLKELTKKLKTFYSDNTQMSQRQLNSLLKRDLWLNPDKCMEYGLVDEIST